MKLLTLIYLLSFPFYCIQFEDSNTKNNVQQDSFKMLQGYWGINPKKEGAVFKIEKDTIDYLGWDPITRYHYQAINDTLKVYEYGDEFDYKILKLTNDSLVIFRTDTLRYKKIIIDFGSKE